MINAFILRFQETCVAAEGTHPGSGTLSITAVRAEQADSDRDRRAHGALGYRSVSAGTMTKTAIRAEHTDEDRALSPSRLLPVESPLSSGTQTLTNVRAEGADADHGGRRLRAVPA